MLDLEIDFALLKEIIIPWNKLDGQLFEIKLLSGLTNKVYLIFPQFPND